MHCSALCLSIHPEGWRRLSVIVLSEEVQSSIPRQDIPIAGTEQLLAMSDGSEETNSSDGPVSHVIPYHEARLDQVKPTLVSMLVLDIHISESHHTFRITVCSVIKSIGRAGKATMMLPELDPLLPITKVAIVNLGLCTCLRVTPDASSTTTRLGSSQ